MSDANSRPTPDILDRAADALRDTPVPAGPPADLVAATTEAITNRLAGAVPAEITRRQRRRRIMRYIGYGTAATAAAGLLAALGVLWLPGPSSAAEFRKVLDNAEKAKSVRVKASVERDGKWADVQTITRQGDRVRVERPRQTLVLDLQTLDLLTLDPAAKTARRSKLAAQEAKLVAGVLGGLDTIKARLADGDEKAVKEIGTDTLGGKKATKYEVRSQKPEATWTVWVDPKTDLPLRVEMSGGPNGQDGLRLDFDKWNEEFDEKLFRMEVPDGYKLDESPAVPVEQPVLLLRLVAEKVVKAKSYRYVAVYIPLDDPGALPRRVTNLYLGSLQRLEALDTNQPQIIVADWAAKRVLELDTAAKTAQWIPVTDAEAAQTRREIADLPRLSAGEFKGNPDYDVKERPRELVNGRPTRVVEARRKPGAKPAGPNDSVVEVSVVWIDAETGFPVRLRTRKQDPAGRVEAIGMFDKWNEEFDGKLFSLDVPAGYTLVGPPDKR